MKKIFLYIILMVITSMVFGQNVYVVTKTTDPNPFTDPFNNDDALCDPDMYGTLQWAINKANFAGGEPRIEFNIPGTGVQEILINTYLPQIKSNVTIDGTTQAGYTNGNPTIKINGQFKVQFGFNIYGADVKVIGLHIANFSNNAFLLYNSSNSEITDNVITNIYAPGIGLQIIASNYVEIYGNNIESNALNTAGTAKYGVYIDQSEYCIVGSTEIGQANTIANCTKAGVAINGYKFNKISGNIIYNNPVAIQLGATANDNILPPVITSYTNGILSGTALPNSTVEVFGSTGPENANEYLASVVADGGGDWSVQVSTTYEYFAFNMTDNNNNTSKLAISKDYMVNLVYEIENPSDIIRIEIEEYYIGDNPIPHTALHITVCPNASLITVFSNHNYYNILNGFEILDLTYWCGDCLSYLFNDICASEEDGGITQNLDCWINPSNDPVYGPIVTFDPSEHNPGEYIINSQFVNGLFSMERIYITILEYPDVTITPVDPICENANSIDLTAVTNGGVWSGNGITNSTTGEFNPGFAEVGIHLITYSITDTACPAVDTMFIEVLPIPIITANNSGPVCEGTDVNFTSTSTLEIDTYQWFGPGGTLGTEPEFTISPAQLSHAGDYMVTVTATNSCTNQAETTLEVYPNPIVNITADPEAVICNNDPITLEAGEFVSFLWSTGSQEQFLTVTEGNTFYSVTVVDQHGCVGMDTIYVGESNIEIALIGSQGTCGNENNGFITVQANGGTAPYTYSWYGPDDFTASTPSITNLYPGTYTVTVTNHEQCSTTATYTVDALAVPELTITDDIICTETNDGVLSVNVTNMDGPFNFLWSGGQSTNFISNQVAGNYSVTVTATNSCSASISTQITNYPVPEVTITAPNLVVCNNEPIILDAGVWQTYFWNTNATTQQIEVITHDADYSVTITDINGCEGFASIQTTGSNMTIKDTIIVHTCEGQNSGSIDITVIGGDGTLSYFWTDLGSFTATTEDISNLFAGIYYVTITDDNWCQLFGMFEVLAGENPILEATGGHVCNGAATGEAEVVVMNPPGTYTYIWNNSAATPVITDLLPGSYSVTVINDVTGCSASAVSTIEDYIVNAEFSLNDNCLDLDRIAEAWYFNYHFDFEYSAIDWENYDFYWDLGNGTTSTETTVPVDYTLDGYYCVSATVSREECFSTSSETVYVYPNRCFCMEENFEPGFYDDYTINSSGEDWQDLERIIRGQVIVPSGVTLNLNKCLLKFAPNGGITVEQGGILVISETQMTSVKIGPSCDGMWSGIEVHGQWGLPTAQQGSVSFINDGNIIENAHIGILLGERNVDYVCNPHINPELGPFNTQGSCGWVKADNVDFVNNGTDIRFVKPIGNNNYANPSAVRNCDFTCDVLLDECYRSTHPSHYGLVGSIYSDSTLVNTRYPWAGGSNPTQRSPQSIWMQKHKFNNYFDLNTFMNKEICMDTYDSKYNVYKSEFYNSCFGIKIQSTNSTITMAHIIENNTFTILPGYTSTTQAHISITGNRYDRIRDNYFGTSNIAQDQTIYGVYLRGASNFNITENDFIKILTGVAVSSSGSNGGDIKAGTSTEHISWRGNVFTQCKTNILTRGNNSNLRLKCNNCNNTDLDPLFYTVNFENIGLLANQGIYLPLVAQQQTWGAGNEFYDGNSLNNPSSTSRRVKTNTTYTYTHHSNTKTTPTLYPGSSPINFSNMGITKAVNSTACPTLSVGPAFPFNPIFPIIQPIPPIQDFLPVRQDVIDEIASLKLEYNNLILTEDNGITFELLNDISLPMSDEKLKNKLIANSPLSDTVLISLLIEYPLSHGNFKNVMELNMPTSPKVGPYLFARLVTIPQGIYNQLINLQSINPNTVTATSIKRQIDYWENERSLLINDIISTLLDTIDYKPDYVKQILVSENTIESKQLLISTAIAEKDYTTALEIINEIEPVTQEISDWVQYHQILLTLYQQGKTINQMDSLQIAFIMEQAYKCPEDYISANAQVVLYLLYGMEVPECEEMVNRSKKLLVKDVEFTLPETGAFILDNFPDPFVNQTYINYYLPEGNKGSLVVIDVNGKIIETLILNEGENTLEISTTNWEPGVYTFGLYLNENPIEFKKMVKTQ